MESNKEEAELVPDEDAIAMNTIVTAIAYTTPDFSQDPIYIWLGPLINFIRDLTKFS